MEETTPLIVTDTQDIPPKQPPDEVIGNEGVGDGMTCMKPEGNETGREESILEELIQSESSLWLLYIKLAGTIPAMLATLIICSYGDIGGRKLGIVLPPAGSALKSLLFILAMYQDSSMYLLFIGSFIEGIFGSHLTYMGSSYAYMADCTSGPQRPLRFTILQTANVIAGLAHIPFGYWIDASGFLAPFWFVASIFIFAFLYTVFLIPESHPPAADLERSLPEDERGVMGMIQRACKSFQIYITQSPDAHKLIRICLNLLLATFVCRVLFEMGKSAVETLFMLAAPLCLSSTMIGYFNSLSAFIHGIVGLIGTVIFLRWFSEQTVCIFFMLSIIAGRINFAYANSIWILFLVPFVSFGQTATLPLIRAMMSRLTSPQQQGSLFATIFTLESVCEVFSGALFNSIYAATVGTFKGMVFIVQAGILLAGTAFLLIYCCIVRYLPDHNHEQRNVIIETQVE